MQQTGWMAAGTCLMPVFLQSCKKGDWIQQGNFQGDVIIVGAGIAGLYAAEMLIKQGVKVRILEAASDWGGRMRSLPATSEYIRSAELRTLQGEFSVLHDLFRHQNIALNEQSGTNLYYFSGALNTEAEANQNTFFREMLQTVESLNTFDGADISTQAYFEALDVSTNVEHIYNALAGQDYGTSADRIGARGIANQHQRWSAGKSKYTITGNQLRAVIESALSRAINAIEFNKPVSSIDHSGNTVVVHDTAGESHTCDRLLLTVSLDVLKNGSISFSPSLNNAKQNALSRIGIDMSYCALFKVENALWPLSTRRLMGNEIVQSFEVTDDGWVFAEVSGTQAELIAAIFGDPLNIIQTQFDQLYPGAINQITESAIHQWQGSRSYDPPGVGDSRDVLAAAINNKIFFAGEATHSGGHHGTLHGAMETAVRAVTQILTGISS